ncbi:MAG: hypothetical protein J5498_08585 [Bacteroidales bacterium]|nr:hypothetical protein [Bacteroidales bacterium]
MDKKIISALCMAIEEGDTSPDVVDFDEEAFLQNLISGWLVKKSDDYLKNTR